MCRSLLKSKACAIMSSQNAHTQMHSEALHAHASGCSLRWHLHLSLDLYLIPSLYLDLYLIMLIRHMSFA